MVKADESSMNNWLDSQLFIRLFASERKQIAMRAEEKSPVRIFLRLLATSRSEMKGSMK